MTTTIEGVEVAMGRMDTDWRKTAVHVKVASRKKFGLYAHNEIDPEKAGTAKGVIAMVGTAAGACAEYLNGKYGDNIDPTWAVKCGMRAFTEECRMIGELSRTVPKKLERLLGKEYLFKNEEQEFIHRAQWLVDHGSNLTAHEVMAVDTLIARLHQEQL